MLKRSTNGLLATHRSNIVAHMINSNHVMDLWFITHLLANSFVEVYIGGLIMNRSLLA